MPEILFTIPFVALYAILYGVTMKIADLFNEHGLKHWFKWSDYVFGILWGVFGLLLVISDITVANLIVTQVLGYIFRMRIDYRNHAIATLIIIAGFILFSSVQIIPFIVFLVFFVPICALRDFEEGKFNKFWYLFLEYKWHYPIFGLAYSLITAQWLVFTVLTLYPISYGFVRYRFDKRHQK